jgi:LPXTG-motif cell wall-anchored protein
MELLEDASAQTGVPKTTLAAAIVGGAVAGAALVLGSLLRRK